MKNEIQDSINYLRAPRDYFWHWAENGNVIEWRADGTTICYQEVLLALLKQLQTEELPRLGPLLLVLHACQHRFGHRERFGLLKTLGKYSDRTLESKIDTVEEFLRNIYSLPVELRTGAGRVHLILQLFSVQAGVMPADTFTDWVGELETGRWNPEIQELKEASAIELLRGDLHYLEMISRQYPTAESLETMLRIGLPQTPAAIRLEQPEFIYADLLDELAGDPKTAGLSRIARSLLPVMHIPLHSFASGDQPIGGISDITNRGNYDKLLLSELAQDELLLTARLVNNEALYFRREEPPQHPRRKKVVLIDTTIRMWGMPRVFAISAALAYAKNVKQGTETDTYLLGANTFEAADLTNKKGIVNALERLHTGLHAGAALELAMEQLDDNSEVVLITEERQLQSPAFHASFDKVRSDLSFIISVNRDGGIRFSECTRGNAKLLSEAKLDLIYLLFQPASRKSKDEKQSQSVTDLPAFLTKIPLPLLVLKKHIDTVKLPVASNEQGDVLVISKNQRVLVFIQGRGNPAEVLAYIEDGSHTFNWSDPHICFILVQDSSLTKLYKLDLQNKKLEFENITVDTKVRETFFAEGNKLYILLETEWIIYDCNRMQIAERMPVKNDNEPLTITASFSHIMTPETVRSVLNQQNFYELDKFDKVCITKTGELALGRFTLKLTENGIRFDETSAPLHLSAKPQKRQFFPGTKILHQVRTWRDGSNVIIDKRGIIHLRSSNPTLAQVAIILVRNAETTCWASDNKVCGNPNFINYSLDNTILRPADFYRLYIQPIINHIVSNAS